MKRPPVCPHLLMVCLLWMRGGCLGDAERGNPFDPLSDQFEGVGEVTGLVLDRTLQGLPDAEVRLLPDTSVSRAEFVDWTDGQGWFSFQGVPWGAYGLVVAKEGYAPAADSVVVERAQAAEKVVTMEGLPVVTTASFETVHISRRASSQENLYLLDVFADITDPDRASDIEQVWLEIPELGVVYPLEETGTPERYREIIPVDSLPVTSLHELLGRTLLLKVQDRAGLTGSTPPRTLIRIIEDTPVTIEPQDLAVVQEAQPVLKWESLHLPFSFTYRVEVVRVEPNTNLTELVQLTEDISPASVELQVEQPLPSGFYYWAVWVVDEFGNRSRSKEAEFQIE